MKTYNNRIEELNKQAKEKRTSDNLIDIAVSECAKLWKGKARCNL
jgi:hypothetical protein